MGGEGVHVGGVDPREGAGGSGGYEEGGNTGKVHGEVIDEGGERGLGNARG